MRDGCLTDVILAPGGLSVVFQPIFEFREDGLHLHSFESLIRGPKETNIESAQILFDYVRRKRETVRVDRACIETILAGANEIPGSPQLSLNVHALTLGRDETFVRFFVEAAERHAISLESLTIEVVEHAPFMDRPRFLKVLDEFRNYGVKIALDDVGLGQANYQMLLDCRPDYIKIDRYFVNDCHKDAYREAILESVILLARRFGSVIIAEGIETTADFDVVTTLGINILQGFLFSPPLPVQGLMEKDLLRGWLAFPEDSKWEKKRLSGMARRIEVSNDVPKATAELPARSRSTYSINAASPHKLFNVQPHD